MKNNIKFMREKRGMTQKACADTLGITLRAWQTYEQGISEPKNELLCKIADMFGVSLDYLLGREMFIDPLSQLTEEELEQRLIESYLKLPKSYRQLFLQGLREAVAQCYGLKVEDLEKASGKPAELENIINNAKRKKLSAESAQPQVIPAEKPPPTSLNPKPNSKPAPKPQSQSKSKLPQKPTIEIRHSIYKASAGPGYDLTDDDAWEIIKIPDTPEASEADFALTIEGDSMEPDYSDGDIVLVKQQPDVEIGQVGVFIVNGEGYIKERGESCLISRNPARGNIYDEALCVGKVLGKAFEDEDETEE